MSHRIAELAGLLIRSGPASGLDHELTACCQWLFEATDDEIIALLDMLCRQQERGADFVSSLLTRVFSCLVARQRRLQADLASSMRQGIATLYQTLGTMNSARWVLLQWLGVAGGPDDLRELAERMVEDPPRESHAAALALSPLLQRANREPAALFPRLLDALQHPGAAAAVLDVANFFTRQTVVAEHPAVSRRRRLIDLLGALVQQLARLEPTDPASMPDPHTTGQQVDDTVALVVALCDALALIGDRAATGKLYQALELRHRRIQTEAAAALARLGDEHGKEVLVQMVAEPIARLRVLADAEALGLLDRIDPKFTTAQARAEAEVALMLAQPAYFCIPPQELEHVDSRTLYWPGNDRQVGCHLFRYTYRMAGGSYTNIAIAGPLAHTLTADLNDLAPTDIYAVFAGWHAQHESIYEQPPEQWNAREQVEAERLVKQLRAGGYNAIQEVQLGAFVGQWALVARAVRDGVPGIAVADRHDIQWFPDREQQHPMGPTELYWLYKGRRMLQMFN